MNRQELESLINNYYEENFDSYQKIASNSFNTSSIIAAIENQMLNCPFSPDEKEIALSYIKQLNANFSDLKTNLNSYKTYKSQLLANLQQKPFNNGLWIAGVVIGIILFLIPGIIMIAVGVSLRSKSVTEITTRRNQLIDNIVNITSSLNNNISKIESNYSISLSILKQEINDSIQSINTDSIKNNAPLALPNIN